MWIISNNRFQQTSKYSIKITVINSGFIFVGDFTHVYLSLNCLSYHVAPMVELFIREKCNNNTPKKKSLFSSVYHWSARLLCLHTLKGDLNQRSRLKFSKFHLYYFKLSTQCVDHTYSFIMFFKGFFILFCNRCTKFHIPKVLTRIHIG